MPKKITVCRNRYCGHIESRIYIEQKHFDAMMNGTTCKFWEIKTSQHVKYKLASINIKLCRSFEAANGVYYLNCEPIKKETYVKEWFNIAQQLHDDGYIPVGDDSFELKNKCVWLNDMWKTCGKKYEDVYDLHRYDPKWLEEREVNK